MIHEIFSAFIAGFARIFFVSFILWMIGLIILLFREMFSPGELVIRDYMGKVWKMLLSCFEWVAYGAVFVGPVLMFWTKNYLDYLMVTIAAVFLSSVCLSIRKRTGGFIKGKLRMRKEKEHHEDWR
jgi:hypothetical protein